MKLYSSNSGVSLQVTLAALLLLMAHAAFAEVRLENSLNKVVRYVDEAGQVKRKHVPATSIVPGDELQYVVRFTNEGDLAVDAGTIVITDMIPEHTEYLAGTAYGSGTQVLYSIDGEAFTTPDNLLTQDEGESRVIAAAEYTAIRWVFAPGLAPGESSYVSFNVRLK